MWSSLTTFSLHCVSALRFLCVGGRWVVGVDGSAAAEGQSQLGFITGSELMRSPRVPAVRLARRARSQWPRPRHHPRPLHHRPHPRRPHPRWPLATGFRARATVTSRAELADLVARSVGLVHVPRWHQTNHRFSLTSSNSRDSFGFLPLTLHFSMAVWILHLQVETAHQGRPAAAAAHPMLL